MRKKGDRPKESARGQHSIEFSLFGYAALALAVILVVSVFFSLDLAVTGAVVSGDNASFIYTGPQQIVFNNDLTMDLSYYFNQSGLTFLATDVQDAHITVEGGAFSLNTNQTLALFDITVIGSVGDEFLQVPITFIADNTQQPTSLAYPFDLAIFKLQDQYGVNQQDPAINTQQQSLTYDYTHPEDSASSSVTLSSTTPSSSEIIAKMGKLASPDGLATIVFAIDNVEVENAQITLAKYDAVTEILRCDDFIVDSFTCNAAWTPTGLDFEQNSTHVWFNATTFSAYAGANEGGGGFSTTVNVAACQELNSADTVYDLTNDITASGTCLEVNANHVTIDCHDFIIGYDSSDTLVGHGINISDTVGLTVQNCDIRDLSQGGTGDFGIGTTGSADLNNSVIINNTISTNGTTNAIGISINGFHNNTVANNTILPSTTATGAVGLSLQNPTHNRILSNNITTINGSGTSEAIRLNTNHFNNTIMHNVINNGIFGSTNYAVILDNIGEQNIIGYNNITTDGASSAFGISIEVRSTNNTIVGNRIFTKSTGSGSYGIRISSAAGFNSNNNTIIGNHIVTNATSSAAIYLGPNVNRTTIINNSLQTNGKGTDHGIWLQNFVFHTNAFANNITINGTSGSTHGILVQSSNNNTFIDNRITRLGSVSEYMIRLTSSGNISFNDTQMFGASNWLQTDSVSTATFSNVSFANPNASIIINDTFDLPQSHSVDQGNVNLTYSSAFINSSNLTFLNKTAKISFNNITSFNAITVDFEDDGTFDVCNAPQCVNESFDNGVLVFNVSSFTTYSTGQSAFTEIGACGLVTTPGNYTLGSNLSAADDCLNITSDNVYLDCMGKTVTYNTGAGGGSFGITTGHTNNVEIHNCVVQDQTTGGLIAYGIQAYTTNNVTITNNTVSTNGTGATQAIRLFNFGNNTIIKNNIVRVQGTGTNSHGIFTNSHGGGEIVGNDVFAANTVGESYGIYLTSLSNNFLVSNNSIVVNSSSTGSNRGVQTFSTVWDTVISYNNLSVQNSGTAQIGIILQSGVERVNVTNNIVKTRGSSANADAIALSGNINDSIIAHNTIEPQSSAGAGADGIVLISSQKIHMHNNSILISDSRSRGILIQSGTNSSIFNNTRITVGQLWINFTSDSQNISFINTTFNTTNGQINIPGTFTLNGTPDIDKSNLNILFNSSFINTSNRPELNQTGIITLRGVNLPNPQVLVDFEDDGTFENCNSPTCQVLTNGTDVSFNVSRFSTFSLTNASDTPSCSILTSDFTMTSNLTSGGTCFTIDANAITLDCDGHYIFYDATGTGDPAINITGDSNTVVTDCNIVDVNDTGSGAHGIFLDDASNNLITNTTIQTNATSSTFGIFLDGTSSFNNITNSTIITLGSAGNNEGINLEATSDNNRIVGNSIVTNGTSSNRGMQIDSDFNFIVDNRVQTFGSANNNDGIAILESDNYIANNTILVVSNGGFGDGISMTTGDRNNATGNTIQTSGTGANNDGISVASSSTNNWITNNLIRTDGTSSNRGIDLDGDFANVHNNTIYTNGSSSNNEGIDCAANDVNITNNTITTNGTASNVGFDIFATCDNIFIENTKIITDGNESGNDGMNLDLPSFVDINNTNITVFGVGNGIDNNGALNATFRRTSVQANLGPAILIDDSIENEFYDTLIANSLSWVDHIQANASISTNFTNTTILTEDGFIRFLALFGVNGTHNITRNKLNVSINLAFLNSSNLSFLNNSATIGLRNATSTQPQVDFEDDGTFEVCNPPQCTATVDIDADRTFNVSSFTGYQLQDVNDCGNITSDTTLDRNHSAPGTCWEINVSDVTFDCAGFTSTFATTPGAVQYGILVSADNVTVKNCRVIDGNSSGNFNRALAIINANNVTAINNIFQSEGVSAESNAVHVGFRARNNTIINNTIISLTSSFDAIQSVDTSGNNSYINNTIISNGSGIEMEANDKALYNNITSIGSGLQLSSSPFAIAAFNIINNFNGTADCISVGADDTQIFNNTFSCGNSGIGMGSSDRNLIENHTISRMRTSGSGIAMTGSDNNIIRNNKINNGSNCIGIGEGSSDNLVEANVMVNCSRGIRIQDSSLTFYLQLFENNQWMRKDPLSFSIHLKNQTTMIPITPDQNGDITVRLEHDPTNVGAAHIDAIYLQSHNIHYPVSQATNLNHSTDIGFKVNTSDLDIADALGDTLELSWNNLDPSKTYFFTLNAREEAKRMTRDPLHNPRSFGVEESFLQVTLNNNFKPTIDGEIDRTSEWITPTFVEHWVTGTGHPSADNLWYVTNDNENLYIAFEFTSDNSYDHGEDWSSVHVKVGDETKTFVVNSTFNEYGITKYTYTDSIHYQHTVAEFNISLNEIQANVGDTLNIAFSAYGTGGASPSNRNNITNNTIHNNTEGLSLQGITDGVLIVNNSVKDNNQDIDGESSTGIEIINTPLGPYEFTSSQFSIEFTELGKIAYRSTLTETGANLSQDISFRPINLSVNSTVQSGLDSPANITFFGVSLSNPKIIFDEDDDGIFADCPANTCNNLSFTASTFIFNVSTFTGFSLQNNVTLGDCGNISTSTILDRNHTAGGTCFVINQSDVTLDCNGFAVIFDNDGLGGGNGSSAVEANGVNNITVKNCVLVDNGTPGSFFSTFDRGINFTNVNNSFILNNTIRTNGTQAQNSGIRLVGSTTNITIVDNNIIASPGLGVATTGSVTNVQIENNSIVANGNFGIQAKPGMVIKHNNITSGSRGITFSDNNVLIDSNFINTSPPLVSADGIRCEGGSGTNITSNTIVTGRIGILISTCTSYRLENNTIRDTASFPAIQGLNADTGFIKNNTVINASHGIVLADETDGTIVDSNFITNMSTAGVFLAETSPASFILQVYNGSEYIRNHVLHFANQPSTQKSLDNFYAINGRIKAQLVHDTDFVKAAFVDALLLEHNGEYIQPSKVTINGVDHTNKLSVIDFDVSDAFDKTIEVEFTNLENKPYKIAMHAREELQSRIFAPRRFPASGHYTLNVGDAKHTIQEFWEPASGDPAGINTWIISKDNKNLNVELDLVSDNSFEGDLDWAEVIIGKDGNSKTFRVATNETTYGTTNFEYTPSVSYEHKVYSFNIPLDEIQALTNNLPIAFRVYGTGGGGPSVRNNITNNIIVNNSEGIHSESGTTNYVIANNTIQDNTEDLDLTDDSELLLLDNPNVGPYTFSNAQFKIQFTGLGAVDYDSSLSETGSNLSQDISFLPLIVVVNSSAQPGLNASANVSIENNTFPSPKPIVDIEDDGTFVDCLSDTCTNLGITGSTVSFDVSRFTAFSLQNNASDSNPPNVTDLVPISGSNFSQGATIEIGANITDDINISNASVNITLPNGTVISQNLTLGSTDFFNISFTLDLAGTYTVRFVANDTSNNVNNTEVTTFNSVAQIFLEPSITLTKADSEDPLDNVTQINYTITISNAGPGNATNVTVTEDYPATASFISSAPTPTVANGTFFLGNITNGTSTTINITINISTNLTDGTVLTNTINATFFNDTNASNFATTSESTTFTLPGAPAPAAVQSGGIGGRGGGSRGVRRVNLTVQQEPVQEEPDLIPIAQPARSDDANFNISDDEPAQVTPPRQDPVLEQPSIIEEPLPVTRASPFPWWIIFIIIGGLLFTYGSSRQYHEFHTKPQPKSFKKTIIPIKKLRPSRQKPAKKVSPKKHKQRKQIKLPKITLPTITPPDLKKIVSKFKKPPSKLTSLEQQLKEISKEQDEILNKYDDEK